jgi:RNase P subunit RPR2
MEDSFLVGVLICAFVGVLIFVVKSINTTITRQSIKKATNAIQRYSACPLCGTKLIPGENLVSRIYTTEKSADKPCTIHGCPHCYPQPASESIVRVCPVCNKVVPDDGHLLARIFYRNNQKQHVHVVGCTECHKKQ